MHSALFFGLQIDGRQPSLMSPKTAEMFVHINSTDFPIITF